MPTTPSSRPTKKLIGWLGQLNLPTGPAPCPRGAGLAIKAWDMLGRELDWSGVEIVAEILGIADVEGLVRQLVTIRDNRPER